VAILEILYWGSAYSLYLKVGQCDYWPDGCAGSFFPIPYRGSGICLMVLTPMSSLDSLICSTIQHWIFIPIAIFETLFFAWIGLMLGKRRMRRGERTQESEVWERGMSETQEESESRTDEERS